MSTRASIAQSHILRYDDAGVLIINSLQWSSFLISSQLRNSFTHVSLEASAANRNAVDSDNRGKQTGHPCDDFAMTETHQ